MAGNSMTAANLQGTFVSRSLSFLRLHLFVQLFLSCLAFFFAALLRRHALGYHRARVSLMSGELGIKAFFDRLDREFLLTLGLFRDLDRVGSGVLHIERIRHTLFTVCLFWSLESIVLAKGGRLSRRISEVIDLIMRLWQMSWGEKGRIRRRKAQTGRLGSRVRLGRYLYQNQFPADSYDG
ncbi:uncharacterized protein UV8b_04383 [Ustilaginoidea virens]|uniref:Uncharacterized protein n=1 Tax=Ustilaginoidea virens TaxID=1159556 RepID=A0A8E5HRG5_USTVR|nr:uncharacterized protein UV8b_04383 [Ustilaginoidea virens]QUC20142.1 hypothetical protein UV8b_04383 [Ustilaginoidea virens]